MRPPQAFDQPSNGLGLGLFVPALFEIEIVHDAADVQRRRILDREPLAEGLEGAVAPVMPEFGLEGVEGNRVRRAAVAAEDERRVRVDEPPDQPGRRHAIDARVRSREPVPAAVPGLALAPGGNGCHGPRPPGRLIEPSQ